MTQNYRVLVPVSHPLGGIRTYMLYNFRQLHLDGYRFTFLSEAGDVFDSFKRDVADWEGTEFVDVPRGGKLVFSIRRALRERRFDLIHSQGLKAGTETAAANYFRQLPHVITLHDVIVPQNDIPGRFKRLKKMIISFVTRRASVIVPVSQDCKENHLQIFPVWKQGSVKVNAIQNGIDIERIENARTKFEKNGEFWLRKQFDIVDNVVIGGFFGRFMPQKGFDILLKSLAIVADRGYGKRFRLVVTRDLNGYFNETLNETKRNQRVADMVCFIDSTPNITPLLLQVDLTIIPSRWEACPILPMESLVLGVPVVGSDCIGLREVVRDTPSIVVESENPDSLADAIIKFIEEPTTKAANEYAETAVKRFDVRIAVKHLTDVYESVIDKA
ncbi:MAG: glycosyltransferase family 4 protein [Planctomycetaceae bacterium]|jgi:glycosyltransferase involved in cell wall biosynthesis|nr:glycosyltransferase family 4 protein [Planctomycetaceae bacterium]